MSDPFNPQPNLGGNDFPSLGGDAQASTGLATTAKAFVPKSKRNPPAAQAEAAPVQQMQAPIEQQIPQQPMGYVDPNMAMYGQQPYDPNQQMYYDMNQQQQFYQQPGMDPMQMGYQQPMVDPNMAAAMFGMNPGMMGQDPTMMMQQQVFANPLMMQMMMGGQGDPILIEQQSIILNSGQCATPTGMIPPPPEEKQELANFNFEDTQDFPSLGGESEKKERPKVSALPPSAVAKKPEEKKPKIDTTHYQWPQGFDYLQTYEKDFFYIEEDEQTGQPQPNESQWSFMLSSFPDFFDQEGQMVGDFAMIFNYFMLCYNLINHAEDTNPYLKKPQNASAGFNYDSEDEDYDEEQERRRQQKSSYQKQQQKKKKKKATAGPQPVVQKDFKPKKPKNTQQAAEKARKEKEKLFKAEVQEDTNIVDVDETRSPASLVFIGHVDVGKSTICGQLMFLSGVVDQRTIQKYKEEAKEKNRDSWWLAYVMDINDDEKAKGKTVEVGRAPFETNKIRYTIFDAPGHKNYVPNMIMGAAMADFAALVISARKGEFEAGFEKDGQTREHAQLAKSLGVSKLIVIVNKMDEASVKWKKERYDEILAGLIPFLKQTGYDIETEVIFLPVSGITGDNLYKPLDSKVCSWYKGPCLFEVLDDINLPKRDPEGPIRVPVMDKMKDMGVVMFGKVEQGTVKMGSKLSLLPNDYPCQVVNIYNNKEECVRYAKPGENVKIRVRLIDDESLINKGDVLSPIEAPAHLTELMECEIDILQLLEHKPIVSSGYQCIFHCHTISDEIVIKDLLKAWEKDEKGEIKERIKPKFVKGDCKILCRVASRIPIVVEKYEQIPAMGRFTLRDEGKTIAIGKIMRIKPVQREKRVFEVTEEKKN